MGNPTDESARLDDDELADDELDDDDLDDDDERPASTERPGAWDLEWQPPAGTGRAPLDAAGGSSMYAEVPIRAIAFAIDFVLLAAAVQLIGQGMSLVLLWISRSQPDIYPGALQLGAGAVVLASLAVGATAIYFWRAFRATPGQMILGLFVLDADTGLRISGRSAAWRWLLLYAPLTPILTYSYVVNLVIGQQTAGGPDPLVIAAIAFFVPLAWYALLAQSAIAEKRRGRALHDRAARSVVVRRLGAPS